MGIPTMVVTRQGFPQVVGNAFAGLGFAPEGPTVYEFPIEMFLQGSDLTPITENIDKIVYGLTQWEPRIKEKGVYYPSENIVAQGADYHEAVQNMNNLFLRNMWSDGLPVTPATQERVDWILTGTDLSPDTEIGRILPRGGIGTVQALAVALAMAGGRPEHMPVLIAAVDAITEFEYDLHGMNATTCSVFPVLVVNGPIAKQIRLNSGYGLLGPDPQHPAGGPIGRALRIIQQDMGGALPGIGTMAIYGGMRYTNAVFAEDEEGIPEGWTSLSVDRGFAKDANIVTAMGMSSMQNINNSNAFGTKETNDETLVRIANVMNGTNNNTGQGLVLLPRGFADSLASTSGYSKEDVKAFLWENSKTPWSLLLEGGMAERAIKFAGTSEGEDASLIATEPEFINLVIAGGAQSGHAYWMQPGAHAPILVSREIELPANWDDLLEQAENDIGPAPAE
jgi:hypothetical protein